MCSALVRFHHGPVNVEKTGKLLRGNTATFSGMSSSVLRPSSIFSTYMSTEFHDMRTECQIKSIIIHFLLYYFFQSLPNHLRPNLLACQSLAPQYVAPRLLAP